MAVTESMQGTAHQQLGLPVASTCLGETLRTECAIARSETAVKSAWPTRCGPHDNVEDALGAGERTSGEVSLELDLRGPALL